MRYDREGWPQALDSEEVKCCRKLKDKLSTESGCFFHGARIVIPRSLRSKVLDMIHLGYSGMQRMKQLARTAVYRPHINDDMKQMSRTCTACADNQSNPPKPTNHPWMLPEKPWTRLHLSHAINFLGTNWLVLVGTYSKYPCIHPTSSTPTRANNSPAEARFAHFGYPPTLVTDNTSTFMSEEFQAWCRDCRITHLTGVICHPATNGAAERLMQCFK